MSGRGKPAYINSELAELTVKYLLQALAQVEFSMLKSSIV